jgi:hypothetical protein
MYNMNNNFVKPLWFVHLSWHRVPWVLWQCYHFALIRFVQNWRQFFVHKDNYFEYLLGDSSYTSEEMFVMCWLKRQKLALRHDLEAMYAYNKMHVRYKVWAEWGIGGLKRKWKKLMKRFDSTKPKYNHLFRTIIIFINFLYMHHLDFTTKVIGNHIINLVNYGWNGDY